MKPAIVCGLKSEAETVQGCNAPIAVSGASAERAYQHALRLVDDGATALVSLGVSGGLDPLLEVGELIVPRAVVNVMGETVNEVAGGTLELSSASILGSDDLIANAEQKTQLLKDTGGVAVDMESHAVARAAAERGRPFFAIRAIADPAAQVIPVSAVNAVANDGSVRTLSTIIGLLRHPQSLPGLVALGRQSAKAHATLAEDAPRLIEMIIRA